MSVSSSAVVAAPVRATAPLPSSPFPFQGLVVPMGPGNWPAPSAITHASDKEKERYHKDYNCKLSHAFRIFQTLSKTDHA